MYDFIYDTQEIYDYYDQIFEEKNNSMDSVFIDVRNKELPYALALENFDDLLMEFQDDKDMMSLANLRWYICQLPIDTNFTNEKHFSKIIVDEYNFSDDLFSMFSTTFTDTLYTSKIIEECQIKNSNHILSLLNSIVLTITFFCKLSFNFINKFSHVEPLFLDCYVKKYKSYLEAAIKINQISENLNVIVNYLYETIHKDYPKNPKFSMYRLMVNYYKLFF